MASHFWVLSIGKLFIFWLTIGSRYSDSRNVGQLQNVEPSDPKKYTNVLQNLEVIVRETGKYGTIEVIKDTLRDRLYMKNGNSILGSEKIEARTSTLMSQHIQSAVVYTRPNMKCFLQIGLGVGSVSKSLWRWKSHVHIDVVELNPLVVSFAKKHFGWRNFKGNTFTMDGRQFLDKAKELTLDHKYDAILIDVYSDLGMNSSNDGNYMGNIVGMYTRECFEKVKERLKDGGVLVVTIVGSANPPHNEGPSIVFATLRSVFAHVRVFLERQPELENSLGHIIFFASENAIVFSFPHDFPNEIRTFLNWEIFHHKEKTYTFRKIVSKEQKEVSSTLLCNDHNASMLAEIIRRTNDIYWRTILEPDFIGPFVTYFEEDAILTSSGTNYTNDNK